MLRSMRRLRVASSDMRGVAAMEYALIAGVLGTLLIAGFTVLGTDLQAVLVSLATRIVAG